MVTDEKLLDKIGAELTSSIPGRLALIGAVVSVNVAYQQSAFLCLEVNLTSVDLIHLITVNAGPAAGNAVRGFFEKVGLKSFKEFVETNLVRLLAGKVSKGLPGTIKEKLKDKMLADIEIFTLSEAEEGPFLIHTIQQLNAEKDKENKERDANNNTDTNE